MFHSKRLVNTILSGKCFLSSFIWKFSGTVLVRVQSLTEGSTNFKVKKMIPELLLKELSVNVNAFTNLGTRNSKNKIILQAIINFRLIENCFLGEIWRFVENICRKVCFFLIRSCTSYSLRFRIKYFYQKLS